MIGEGFDAYAFVSVWEQEVKPHSTGSHYFDVKGKGFGVRELILPIGLAVSFFGAFFLKKSQLDDRFADIGQIWYDFILIFNVFYVFLICQR